MPVAKLPSKWSHARGKRHTEPPRSSTAAATTSSISDPDSYTCAQQGYIDFEQFSDQTNLSAETFTGIQFTTTGGYTWLVGDFATGSYNGKYPSGDYMSQGTHWAWLGENQGVGRIDLTDGPARHFSLLTSSLTPVSLEAYSSDGTLLETAGPSIANTGTGAMDELVIEREQADVDYLLVHDSGNYFLIDAVCTDAPGVPTPPDDIGRYVALGDSYSAGEGNPPFLPGTDITGGSLATRNECHRSSLAYGPLLADQLAVSESDFVFAACSGAILADISESVGGVGQWGEGAQLDDIAPFDAPSTTTSLVTLTIGGNDAGFADGLNSCIRGLGQNQPFHGDCRNTLNTLAKQGLHLPRNGGSVLIDIRDGTWKPCGPGTPNRTCEVSNIHKWLGTDKYFVARTVSDLAGMFRKIRDRAPNAHILVPLYPHLFSNNPPNKCIVGQAEGRIGNAISYTIDKDAAIRINQLTDDFDQAIMNEVQQARSQGIDVDYVETRDTFYGHGVECIDDPGRTRDPWLNGLVLEDATRFVASPSPFSFHPNRLGQAEFARLVEDEMK